VRSDGEQGDSQGELVVVREIPAVPSPKKIGVWKLSSLR